MSQFDIPPGVTHPKWVTRPDQMPNNPPTIPDAASPVWERLKEVFSNPAVNQAELLKIIQQYFLDKMNANRPNSPLDPNMRPGVPDESKPGGMMQP